jgi:hypothetical protein
MGDAAEATHVMLDDGWATLLGRYASTIAGSRK